MNGQLECKVIVNIKNATENKFVLNNKGKLQKRINKSCKNDKESIEDQVT